MSGYRSVLSALYMLVGLLLMGASVAQAQSGASTPESAKLAFEKWLATFSDPSIGVSTDGIAFDQSADRLTVSGLTFTFNARRVNADAGGVATVLSFDELGLEGFEMSTNGISFDNAIAEGIRLQASAADSPALSLQSLTLQNIFLPRLTSLTMDPLRPISSQVALLRRLSTASAGKVTFVGLDAGGGFTAGGGELSTIALGAVERLKLTAVSSMLSAVAGNATVQNKVEAKSIVVNKIDLDPYLRLFEASAYFEAGAARPWRNIIEKIDVGGLVFEGQGTRLVSDAVTLDGLRTRQFSEDITELFNKAAIDPAYLAGDQNAASTFTAAIRGAFAIDAISVGATSVTASNAEGTVNIAAASGLISGLAADRIDVFNVAKVSYSDASQTFQTENLRLERITLPTRVAGQPVSAASASIPQVGSVQLAGFRGKIGEAQFGVGQFNLDMAYFLAGTPTKVELSLDNLSLKVAQIAVPGIRDTLTAFGYQDIDVSLALAGSWQERSSEIAIENAALGIAGLGKLSASGTLTGVTRAGLEDPAVKFRQELAAGGLKSFRLLFENETFFQSFITEVAKQNKRSAEEISKALASNMPAIMQNVKPPAIKNKLIFSGVSFVNDPRSLEFVSSTPEVVAWSDILAAFAAPAGLPGLLDLDVRANGRQ